MTSSNNSLRHFFQRHPLLADSFRWVLPALVIGAVLRVLFITYVPYAVWGPDSRSYYIFAHRLFYGGAFSLAEKRRYLYPLLLAPMSLLPGGVMRWLPFIQHTLGLTCLLPLAYIIRRTLVCWRIWIIPITVLYGGFPIILWSEHELLGEHLFFATLLWSFAGWVAWVSQSDIQRARGMFWWFFVPFTLFILTKPAGRFVWPGIFVGFVLVAVWRLLSRKQIVALLALIMLTPAVGSRKQGAWILYTATFPLTQLETPLHAEYKAEIRDLVQQMRAHLDTYYVLQYEEPYYFIRDPGEQKTHPLWKALGNDEKLKSKIYMDLALEGIKARPDLLCYLAWERLVASMNESIFGADHFDDGHYVDTFAEFYKDAYDSPESSIRLALALPRTESIARYASLRRKFEPAPGSWMARTVQKWVGAWGQRLDFFRFPNLPKFDCGISLVRATPLAWWLLLGMFLSLLPRYRRTLGVWMLTSLVFMLGVFLVSLVSPRYVAPVWPVLLILLAVPADVLCSAICPRLRPLALASPGSKSETA
jgi:hypothetical protein